MRAAPLLDCEVLYQTKAAKAHEEMVKLEKAMEKTREGMTLRREMTKNIALLAKRVHKLDDEMLELRRSSAATRTQIANLEANVSMLMETVEDL
ncbi:hypothetical protein BDN70DRAFT_998753, partial [Pholiota conissans]